MDNTSAVKHIPIFYACDDHYAPFMAVSIASILFNTPTPVDFYVLDCGMSQITMRKINMLRGAFPHINIETIQIDTHEKFGHLELRNNLTPACFARFLIPSVKPDLGTILYLDCDTIAVSDITPLFEHDLNGHTIGAVVSIDFMDNTAQKQDIFRGADLSNTHEYFNSGVMLIDTKKWNTNNTLALISAAERATAHTRMFNDQDILNHTFDSNFEPLPLKYNVRTSILNQYDIDEIVIRHFTGGLKPWIKSGFLMPHASDFWFYAGLTPFFPELITRGVGDPTSVSIRRVLQG